MANIYVDPTNEQDNQNGTIENPYSSFDQFCSFETWGYVLPSDSKIMIKSGTEMTFTSGYVFDFGNWHFISGSRNIELTSYGEGSRPVIRHEHTNPGTCRVSQGENIYIHGLCFIGGTDANLPHSRYVGAAFVAGGEDVGSRTWNIHIYDNEVSYYDTFAWLNQYTTDEGVVFGNIYFGDAATQTGNTCHHCWSDGFIIGQLSKFSNTGEFYFGYNRISYTSMGWVLNPDLCGSGAEGDQLQVGGFDKGIIEHNIFDKRGVSGKMVFLWSIDPYSERDYPGSTDTHRNLIFRYNTIYPGLRFKTPYYCDGYNVGNHSILQIYRSNGVWIYGNKFDASQYEYTNNIRYNRDEETVGALAIMTCRNSYVYDNAFINTLPGNLLQSEDVSGSRLVWFINNTVLSYVDPASYENNSMFSSNGEITYRQNNILLGSTNLLSWYSSIGLGSTDVTNISEMHGTGSNGDLAYFGSTYGFVDAENFDLRPNTGSSLIGAGTAYNFDMTGWPGEISSSRYDPNGLLRPQSSLWTIGAFEFPASEPVQIPSYPLPYTFR